MVFYNHGRRFFETLPGRHLDIIPVGTGSKGPCAVASSRNLLPGGIKIEHLTHSKVRKAGLFLGYKSLGFRTPLFFPSNQWPLVPTVG